jgi:hypothetical protein
MPVVSGAPAMAGSSTAENFDSPWKEALHHLFEEQSREESYDFEQERKMPT